MPEHLYVSLLVRVDCPADQAEEQVGRIVADADLEAHYDPDSPYADWHTDPDEIIDRYDVADGIPDGPQLWLIVLDRPWGQESRDNEMGTWDTYARYCLGALAEMPGPYDPICETVDPRLAPDPADEFLRVG